MEAELAVVQMGSAARDMTRAAVEEGVTCRFAFSTSIVAVFTCVISEMGIDGVTVLKWILPLLDFTATLPGKIGLVSGRSIRALRPFE